MPVLPSDTDSQREMLSSKIEDLNLSVRAYNSLRRAGIDTIGQVIDLREDGVLKIRNLGQLQLDEIFDATAKFFGVSRRYLATLTLEPSTENSPEKDAEASTEVTVHPPPTSPRHQGETFGFPPLTGGLRGVGGERLPTEADELSQDIAVADFAELFTLAQTKALDRRENKIVELRYGFTGGEAHTLEEIGEKIGVSRERIRQILNKCHRKIVSRGEKDIRTQQINEPCGVLLSYVNQSIHPKDENATQRLVDFTENELPYLPVSTHALPLITHLVFHNKAASKKHLTEARKIVKKRSYERQKAYKQQIRWEKFEILLSFTTWPGPVKTLSADKIASLERQRDVSPDGEGHAGSFHSSKLNRCVQYESGLEHDFLQKLETFEQIVFYQEQPYKIPYKLKNQEYFYYPDILFVLQNGRGIIVEIKPVFKMALQINLKKWTALKHFCVNNGLGLLITDGRYTIQQIQRHEINPQFAEEILSALEMGVLYWREYTSIRDKYQVNRRNDFLALVLKNRLVWQLNPFRLSKSV